jgi:SpoVK/Ycf46/Vps4 family AAA+-type ATPase
VRNNLEITPEFLAEIKKESIEKEAAGKLDFLESKLTLENVAGHKAVKCWLREDASLMKKGVTAALPMGYLISGRIGTGKTYLVKCFAGECGVPFVELKNFRDKWVGATEGNLEKIFSILHALGSVVVFVDEADQATGKRSAGDETGISGRVYAMLAKEMSDTANRGKIIWIFATSRPDLVEIDLKRQGRLDVHIPLFPPESDDEKKQLFVAMARKLGIPLKDEDIPELPFAHSLGGNEIEGLLVRTLRIHALQEEGKQKSIGEILKDVISGFKPSAHTRRLELMDYLAVKECTDSCFLPQRFIELSNEEIETKIVSLM